MTIKKYKDGWIEVVCGPMYAGKSSELLRKIELLKYSKLKFKVFVPKMDNRYGLNNIANHNGASYKAISVQNVEEIESQIKSDTQFIVIDEIQLFGKKLVPLVVKLAKKGINVIASGLTSDFRGNPFEVTIQLLGRAEFIKKLQAICQKCFGPASMSQRLSNGKPASANEETIKVGSKELYEPRCRQCHEIPDYEWWKVYN